MTRLRDFVEPGVPLAAPQLRPFVEKVIAAAAAGTLAELRGEAAAAALALVVDADSDALLDQYLEQDAAASLDIAIRRPSLTTRFGLNSKGSLACILERLETNPELRIPDSSFWFVLRRQLDEAQRHRRPEARQVALAANLSNLALRAAVAYAVPDEPLWSEAHNAEVRNAVSFLDPTVANLYLLGVLRHEAWAVNASSWPPSSKAMQKVPAPLLSTALALIGDQRALTKLQRALEAREAAEDLDSLIDAPLDEDHVLLTWARAKPAAEATKRAIARMLSSSPTDATFLRTLITSWLLTEPDVLALDAVATQLRAEAGGDLPVSAKVRVGPPAKKNAKWPSWLDERRLPGLALRDGKSKLGSDSVHAFIALAQQAKLGDATELTNAVAGVKSEALAAFAAAVFVAWLGQSGPPKERWAIELLAHFPHDAWARVLGVRCEAWARGSHSARAKLAVEVLGFMPSRVAMLEVQRLSLKVRTKSLRQRAGEVFQQAAQRLGLGPDELDDRLVPDCGLTRGRRLEGGLEIDLTADLKPVLVRNGTKVDKLPTKAPAHDVAAWAAVKAAAKQLTLAAKRLERAMVDQRTLPAEHFIETWLMHPLLSRIAERVIWVAEPKSKSAERIVFLTNPLRRVGDKELSLEPTMRLRPVHPLELTDAERSWLAGAIEHPAFLQLGRAATAVQPAELKRALRSHIGRTVRSGVFLGLEHEGWVRGTPIGRGLYDTVKRSGEGWSVELEFEPGIYLGDPRLNPEQAIGELRIEGAERMSQVMRAELAASLERAFAKR